MRFWQIGIALMFAVASVQAADKKHPELKDIFFGEALYYAFQKDFFNAIKKLDTELGQYYAQDEPDLDPFHLHIDQAEFSVGDLELSYRMHRKAGRAIQAVLESNVDQSIRNEAAYRLAKIYFQKGQPANALHTLERIKGDLPESAKDDEAFLRGQVYIANGRFTDAVDILRKLQGNKKYRGFAEYNLAIALIQTGQEDEGLLQLNRVGQLGSDKQEVLALKDKANLTLASRLLENEKAQQARQYFERVRLKGPYSNRALLGAGWVDVATERYDRALVPWTMLHERAVTNDAVQEVMLAVPYAYGKLEVHGKAAILYGKAMDVFGNEVVRLDRSIKSIREGKFISAILREEGLRDSNWLIKLRELPETPETLYLQQLMASHDFQESLKNYRDLFELQIHVKRWQQDLYAFEEIIEYRRQYYEPLLPVVEKQFKRLDSRLRLRLEQRDRLDKRLKAMLVSRRPEYLATVDERLAQQSLARIERYLSRHPQRRTRAVVDRFKRLKGVLSWQVAAEYDERLTEAYNHLHQLDAGIDRVKQVYGSFVRTRQAATQSYEGYRIPIQMLRTKLQAAEVKLTGIVARQGRMLETLAINELDRRRQRLEEYQVKARFALAESYDRATKKAEEERKQEEQAKRDQAEKDQPPIIPETEQPPAKAPSSPAAPKVSPDKGSEKPSAPAAQVQS
ncbi:MAG: tetratricopeptide repeat protein [Gammaproteobacteria bacterium]